MWEDNYLYGCPTAKPAWNQLVSEEATKGVKEKTSPAWAVENIFSYFINKREEDPYLLYSIYLRSRLRKEPRNVGGQVKTWNR